MLGSINWGDVRPGYRELTLPDVSADMVRLLERGAHLEALGGTRGVRLFRRDAIERSAIVRQ